MNKKTLKRMRDYEVMELQSLKYMLQYDINTKEECIDEFDNKCTGFIDCLFFNDMCTTKEFQMYRRAIVKLANKYRRTI